MARAPSRLTALVASLVFFDIALWSAVVPLLPHWEQEIGLSKDGAGLVVGAYSGAVLLASLPVGRLADRVGARRITAWSSLLFALSIPFLGAADAPWELILIRFGQGLSSAVSWTAGLAWLAAASPEGKRGASLALVNAVAAIGALAGPLLGGPLVDAVGLVPGMLAVGAVVLVLGLWALVEPEPPPGPVSEHSFREAARAARREERLRAAYLGILYVSAASGVVQVLGPLHLADVGLDTSQIGWIFTAAAGVSAVVTLLLGRLSDRIDRLRMSAPAMALVALSLLPLAFDLPTGAYAAAVVLVGSLNAVEFVLAFPLCADGAERAGIGQGIAIGALNTLWAVGALLGPIGGANLGEALGDGVAYVTVAAIGVACAGLLVRRPQPVPS